MPDDVYVLSQLQGNVCQYTEVLHSAIEPFVCHNLPLLTKNQPLT